LRQPGNEEDEAKEGEAISATVNYATSVTFDDEQHANKNNVAAGGNDNAGGKFLAKTHLWYLEVCKVL
jgi:hypothetical protein